MDRQVIFPKRNSLLALLFILFLATLLAAVFFWPSLTGFWPNLTKLWLVTTPAPAISATPRSATVINGTVKAVESPIVFVKLSSGREVKVVTDRQTSVTRMELPFDPQHLPKEAVFTPAFRPIRLADLKAGQKVSLEGRWGVDRQTFVGVTRLQVLP